MILIKFYRKLSFIILFLMAFFVITSKGYSQERPSNTPIKGKIIYNYTFEGLQNIIEKNNITEAILKLKGVSSAEVVFKSAAHQYALLHVIVDIPTEINENNKDITGSVDLKKALIRLGYTPYECKIISENN